MRRPNPWIVIPSLVSGIAGAVVGYFITEASCAPDSCVPSALLVALGVGVAVTFGIGVVAVLAVRSLAEWREHAEREIVVPVDDQPPTH